MHSKQYKDRYYYQFSFYKLRYFERVAFCSLSIHIFHISCEPSLKLVLLFPRTLLAAQVRRNCCSYPITASLSPLLLPAVDISTTKKLLVLNDYG
jgi:hypothetical protein